MLNATCSRHAMSAMACLLFIAIAIPSPAHADDLFVVTSVGGGTIVDSDSDVLDLLEDAIERNGAFASQSGQATVADLNYGGVASAVRISINAAETSATLAFPITGFSRVFTGTDADDLEDQIEDFLKEDGAGEYAALLKALNEQSVVGVFDGNPFASTAIFARSTFNRFGINGAGNNPTGYVLDPDEGAGDWYFSLAPAVDVIDADGFEGGAANISASGGFNINEVIGLSFGGSYSVVNYDGTFIFHGSAQFGLPINIIPASEDLAVDWQVTPFVSTGFGVSQDAAAGGAFNGIGAASHVGFQLGDNVHLNWGSQIVHYSGYDIEYDDYEFETDLDQQLVTTGLIARILLDDYGASGLFLDGGLTYNTYLQDAAVDHWLVPELGLGWAFGGDSFARIGYRGMFGENDFNSHGVSASLLFGL